MGKTDEQEEGRSGGLEGSQVISRVRNSRQQASGELDRYLDAAVSTQAAAEETHCEAKRTVQ